MLERIPLASAATEAKGTREYGLSSPFPAIFHLSVIPVKRLVLGR